MKPLRRIGVVSLTIAVLGTGGGVSREVRERAHRQNNEGVGLLEQFRPQEAAAAFRRALTLDPDQALARINLAIALVNIPDLPEAERAARAAIAARPDSPHAHYALGLAAGGQQNSAQALVAFRKVLELDPTDVGVNVNLGQIYLRDKKYTEAVAAFRVALATEPWNATATYNLGLSLSRSGLTEEGRSALDRFRALREAGYGTLISQTYPEQGRYAEGQVATGAEADLVDRAIPAVKFAEDTENSFGPASNSSSPEKPATKGRVTLLDFDQDGDLDVFDVGSTGQRLFRNDGGRFRDVTRALGLNPSTGGVGALAGDLDNDTWADLLVLRAKGVTLYRNGAGQGLTDVTATAGLSTARPAMTAALADLDHDGDLDILLAGAQTSERLYQNKGDATFRDVAQTSLTGVHGVTAVIATDFDNGRDIDLVEIVAGAPLRLLRNLRDGSFKDVGHDVGLAGTGALTSLAVADINKDTYSDFFLGSDGGDLIAESDAKGGFRVAPAPWRSAGTKMAQFLDYDNDGLLDLLTFSVSGARLLRNLGDRWMDVSEKALTGLRTLAVTSVATADLDGDGDSDVLVRRAGGELRIFRNEGGNRNRSLPVRLTGLVSNRSGLGAKVELRAGSLSQRLETSVSTPSAAPADVLFGLGRRDAVDAVRVIWPAGVLQTELSPPLSGPQGTASAPFAIKELNRKPSSCPYLYAWNGKSFEFITDFMGGGEMGYYVAPGVWNEPDPVEYVRLTEDQLQTRDGRYELRVTNELEEALFVDHLALFSIAHPRDVEIYPNEGMTSPPKPVRFFAARDPRPPVAARDEHGHDVLPQLLRADRFSPDDFQLSRFRGYADDHTVILDLGATQEASLLLLTGWTDYAWSSDNVAAQQAGLDMQPPSLDVRDASGAWVRAVKQIGVPVGRPQTVVVDLKNIWKGPSREVRIATNMRIYWDQIRVAESVDLPGKPERLATSEAGLRERGFSAETTPDGREPFVYDYSKVSRTSPWKAFPGRYTREGDVRELLLKTDDVFVTSRPGDEIALAFDASALGDLPNDWTRSFLLLSDGFSKEMDIHSATPDAIGPLPFHGMSRYPYVAPEKFPMTKARALLLERYNTRVVKTPVPALDAALWVASPDAREPRIQPLLREP